MKCKIFSNYLAPEQKIWSVLYESFVNYQKPLSVADFAQNLFRSLTTKETFTSFVFEAVANPSASSSSSAFRTTF